jgi:hypothetical protein
MLQIQKAIEDFTEELKEIQRDSGLLYFEDVHLKMLGFLHVLIPRCKRMQLFLAKDPTGQILYTYVTQPVRRNSHSP